MDYLNHLISKWMPEDSKRVAVDSHPRLSGIMDTINATLAHGPATRLPKEFYDPKGRAIIERIGVEEWFSGYTESEEYRALGVGSLLGDIVSRMIGSVDGSGRDGLHEIGGDDERPGIGRGGETNIKFGMSGCHDTTLDAVLASLGALDRDKWPPYSSHIAMELFRTADGAQEPPRSPLSTTTPSASASVQSQAEPKSFWKRLYGGSPDSAPAEEPAPAGSARRPLAQMSEDEHRRLQGFYVRLRYNDRPVTIPGCKAQGKHYDGDESFCTLVRWNTSWPQDILAY